MATQQGTDIVQILEDSRAELNSALSDLQEAHEKLAPADRWSALDCVEHVATVEERFLGRLEAAGRSENPRMDADREAQLSARVSSRADRFVAPEAVRPTGRFATVAEALTHFNAVRTRTLNFATDHSADLYYLSVEHPRFGVMNGVEALRVIAGHACRHAAQIRELREGLASGQ